MKLLMMTLFALVISITGGIVHADPDGGFPLKNGVMTPFPWDNISGVWQMDDPSQNSVYSFDVKKTQDGNKVLQVLQVDKATNQVIAEGAGVAIPDDKNTVSVMMAGEGQEPYMLYVRHVREKKYSRNQATVITIKPLEPDHTRPNANPQDERAYILSRVSRAPFQSPDNYSNSECRD